MESAGTVLAQRVREARKRAGLTQEHNSLRRPVSRPTRWSRRSRKASGMSRRGSWQTWLEDG